MENSLYGKEFIERLTSSGYKSTTYAIAEIVDNSVDAGAKNIQIVFKEKQISTGSRYVKVIDEIIMIDDGKGMSEDKLNGCLTFSEGEGRNDKRIGAFGVGLPNSSINVGRRVDVYSRLDNNEWKWVFLDLDDQKNRDKPGYDKATAKEPGLTDPIQKHSTSGTVVRWNKLKKLEAAKATTLIERTTRLLGRIYRYKIQDGLKIKVSSFLEGNKKYTTEPIEILPNDPMYLMTSKNYITDLIWRSSKTEKAKDPDLGSKLSEFTAKYNYKTFVEGCVPNETTKPLFQLLEDYSYVHTTKIGDKNYNWEIRSSFAFKQIANPGLRSGGRTELGKEIGKKMSGDGNYKSGNIFFLRANREIDYGSFGLYRVTDEKNRFWTIEIHFDSDLDELMGVTNDKQSVKFDLVQKSDIEDVNLNNDLPLGVQRSILYQEISFEIISAISAMRKILTGYAKEFQLNKKAIQQEVVGEKVPIVQSEGPVIQVLNPSEKKWTDKEINDTTTFLKKRFIDISIKDISNQVKTFAEGLTETIVLYAPNETNQLFELVRIQSKNITLINTNHIYYTNMLGPLKGKPHLKVFAISIEMLISAYSHEMNRLIKENEDKYNDILEEYLIQISSRLNNFIKDSNIVVNPKEFELIDVEEDELDE